MARKLSSPSIPPLPSGGGSYELVDGQWICTQRTVQPGEVEPCQNEAEAAAPITED
jgi:hypothetical protein